MDTRTCPPFGKLPEDGVLETLARFATEVAFSGECCQQVIKLLERGRDLYDSTNITYIRTQKELNVMVYLINVLIHALNVSINETSIVCDTYDQYVLRVLILQDHIYMVKRYLCRGRARAIETPMHDDKILYCAKRGARLVNENIDRILIWYTKCRRYSTLSRVSILM